MLSLSHLDGLALGAFAAVLIRDARPADTFRAPAMRLLAGFAGVLAVLELTRGRTGPDDFVIGTIGLWLWSALLACLVLVVASSRPKDVTHRVLAWRPLQAIGRLCYGMYVWHYMLLIALTRRGFTIAALETRFSSTWRAHALFLFVNSASTLLLALISWHLFEKRLLRLKQYFPYANDFTGANCRLPSGGTRAVTGASAAA
jgi:peptidoglycan/LPS O-acetylase OafA/YrhL